MDSRSQSVLGGAVAAAERGRQRWRIGADQRRRIARAGGPVARDQLRQRLVEQHIGQPEGAVGQLDLNGARGIRIGPDLAADLRVQPGVRAVRLSLDKPWA